MHEPTVVDSEGSIQALLDHLRDDHNLVPLDAPPRAPGPDGALLAGWDAMQNVTLVRH